MKKKFYGTLFLCFLSFAAKAATLKQSFDVKIGLFDAAKVDMSYSLSDSDYSFSSKIKTSGLFDTLYEFKAEYLTTGMIDGEKWRASDYHQKTKTATHLRTKRLVFNRDGTLIQRQSAKDGAVKTVDVEIPDISIDAYDIQTALIMMIKTFQQNDSCALDKTIFNGKKVYHISLKDGGRVLFEDKKIKIKKEAHKCLAYIHQDGAEKGDLLWQVSAERPIVFYLMKDDQTGLPFVPKVEISSTPLGDLKASMTTMEINK